MASSRERFWEDHESYAVVGHNDRRPFPRLTYQGLKKLGKTVYAVDPGGAMVQDEPAYRDLDSLPQPVDAVVLELPKDETAEWVRLAARADVRSVWIHQQTDTPEALRLADDLEVKVCHGTCAVMYVTPGLSPHMFHRWVMKLGKKF